MLIAILALAVGTYALRLTGVLLRERLTLSARTSRLLTLAAAALLAALAATAALTQDAGPAGWARPAGVAVGLLLAWRRAPFVLVIVAAAATAAALRLAGVP